MSQLLVSLQNTAVSNGYNAKDFAAQAHEITVKLNLNARRTERAQKKVDELATERAHLIAELASVAGVAG